MLTGLKGLVFKLGINEKGQTPYTIILGKNLILPWMYKTATLYKGWGKNSPDLELVINKKNSTRYRKESNEKRLPKATYQELKELSEYLGKLPEYQIKYLRDNIENIPEKIKRTFYEALNQELFPSTEKNMLYGFEMQKINDLNGSEPKKSDLELISRRLSNKLLDKFYNKLYKKALSITNILPL